MDWVVDLFLADLTPVSLGALVATSFVASFFTAAFGIGGGVLLLAVMASLVPPAALIPVHGVVQLGSNVVRVALFFKYISRAAIPAFAIGSVIGVVAGGALVVELPPGIVQIGIGLFVIWSILLRPPAWLSNRPGVIGAISSFLTMFFGATGVFVANFTKSLALGREAHVATHAILMTIQHSLKVLTFLVLGFGIGAWLPFILVMIAAGFLGTLAGKAVLLRISDKLFRRALDVVLIGLSLRLIWAGVASL